MRRLQTMPTEEEDFIENDQDLFRSNISKKIL